MSVGPSAPPAMTTPGSLVSLMDELTAVQASVPTHPLLASFAEPLNLKRWRPDQADPPMLYNWLLPAPPAEMKDVRRIRDFIVISTRIGISFSEVEDRMPFVEAVADAYRAIIDVAFWNGMGQPFPMRSVATWSMRSTMGSFAEEFGGVPILGIEFTQSFSLDRALA